MRPQFFCSRSRRLFSPFFARNQTPTACSSCKSAIAVVGTRARRDGRAVSDEVAIVTSYKPASARRILADSRTRRRSRWAAAAAESALVFCRLAFGAQRYFCVRVDCCRNCKLAALRFWQLRAHFLTSALACGEQNNRNGTISG